MDAFLKTKLNENDKIKFNVIAAMNDTSSSELLKKLVLKYIKAYENENNIKGWRNNVPIVSDTRPDLDKIK